MYQYKRGRAWAGQEECGQNHMDGRDKVEYSIWTNRCRDVLNIYYVTL